MELAALRGSHLDSSRLGAPLRYANGHSRYSALRSHDARSVVGLSVLGSRAVLVGLLAATYVPTAGADRLDGVQGEKLVGGGLLSVFAVGCPVCNKIVVLALGTGGAMTYFAPLQPVLGFISVGLLLYALRARLVVAETCQIDLLETENHTEGSG